MSVGEINPIQGEQWVGLLSQVASDGRLEFREADAVAREALSGTLTDQRLAMAKGLFEHPPALVEQYGSVNAATGGQALARAFYLGMPRDLAGNAFSGQTFAEGTSLKSIESIPGSTPQKPLALQVTGTADRPYALSFKVAETPIAVNVPRGARPEQTAALVADAINRHSGMIASSANQRWALHFPDSKASCTGIHAQAVGSSVLITPQLATPSLKPAASPSSRKQLPPGKGPAPSQRSPSPAGQRPASGQSPAPSERSPSSPGRSPSSRQTPAKDSWIERLAFSGMGAWVREKARMIAHGHFR